MPSRRVAAAALLAGSLTWGPLAGKGDTIAHAVPVSLPTEIVGGPGSGFFGSDVVVLSNGNFVVTDPGWSSPTAAEVGAVYLFDGATNELVSTLTGSTAGDRIGSYGVVALSTGNFVVSSPRWDFGTVVDAGAVTFGSGTTGVSGEVSSTNSLHGTSNADRIGIDDRAGGDFGGVIPLESGSYLVANSQWDLGVRENVGAVTFGNGRSGVTGPVSTKNSLHGSTTEDRVGGEFGSIRELATGNYLVSSPRWDNGSLVDVGAVTFGDGATGTTGPVSTTNSLHGTSARDLVGDPEGLTPLSNGNYVVVSPMWDMGPIENVGAATFGDGTTGITGPVTTTNSLHGTTSGDSVGDSSGSQATPLANGNYTVSSPRWSNGSGRQIGAVTLGDGTTGVTGPVTATNSLYDTGSGGVTPLTNGNFVVDNPTWDMGPTRDVGAVVFANGTSGIAGPITTANSLHGTTVGDIIGREVRALPNGNYVVASETWDNGATVDAGAVVLGDGATGARGPVSPSNSLYGPQQGDGVGSSVVPLVNGNFVVRSSAWDFGRVPNAGAVTFVNGATGMVGPVTSGNSLHGTTAFTLAGWVDPLASGSYVVRTERWDLGGTEDVGAVTFGDGATGVSGPITTTNSLHGTAARDRVGFEQVTALPNGSYVVQNPSWDLGTIGDAGAVVFGDRTSGVIGPITAANSLHGTSEGDRVGEDVVATAAGKYLVGSPKFDDGAVIDAGALTLADADRGISGPVTAGNSEVGALSGSLPFPWRLDGRLTRAGLLLVPDAGRNRVLLFDDSKPLPNAVVCFAADGTPGDAAIVNLTPIKAEGNGNGLMIASGIATPPVAANVNYRVGSTDPNVAVAPLGPDGRVCYFNSAGTSVHLVADHLGTIDADQYTPASASGAPERRVDTRIGLGGAPPEPSDRLCFPVSGAPGDAAIVNLTPVRARGGGNGQLISSDVSTPPVAANVNFAPGTIDPNVAVAPIGVDGRVCFANSDLSTVDLIADHLGTIDADAYTAATATGAPDRRVDTRSGLGGTLIAPSGRVCFEVTGGPGDVALVNLTPVQARGRGSGQLVSFDVSAPPLAANVNFAPGTIDPNLAASPIGSNGEVCFVNSAQSSVHLVADHLGTIDAAVYTPASPEGAPRRTLDTRVL